ncbi:hypothetical protein ABIC28_002993 [Rhodococcus sp. PvR044]
MLTPIQQVALDRLRDALGPIREFVRADRHRPMRKEPNLSDEVSEWPQTYRQLSSELMNALLVAQCAGVPDLVISEAIDGQ